VVALSGSTEDKMETAERLFQLLYDMITKNTVPCQFGGKGLIFVTTKGIAAYIHIPPHESVIGSDLLNMLQEVQNQGQLDDCIKAVAVAYLVVDTPEECEIQFQSHDEKVAFKLAIFSVDEWQNYVGKLIGIEDFEGNSRCIITSGEVEDLPGEATEHLVDFYCNKVINQVQAAKHTNN